MLYRSAYIQRAKKWWQQDQQQILSALIGESWRMEDPEIQEKYKKYAAIEKKNHMIAHELYRFFPRRKRPSFRRKRGLKQCDPSDRQYDPAGQGFTELVLPIDETVTCEFPPASLQPSEDCPWLGQWCMVSYEGIAPWKYAIGSTSSCRHGGPRLYHTSCSRRDWIRLCWILDLVGMFKSIKITLATQLWHTMLWSGLAKHSGPNQNCLNLSSPRTCWVRSIPRTRVRLLSSLQVQKLQWR
jgi:hypothetical protein